MTIIIWFAAGCAFGLGLGLGAWCMRPSGKVFAAQRDYNKRISELLERKTEAVEDIADIMREKWGKE